MQEDSNFAYFTKLKPPYNSHFSIPLTWVENESNYYPEFQYQVGCFTKDGKTILSPVINFLINESNLNKKTLKAEDSPLIVQLNETTKTILRYEDYILRNLLCHFSIVNQNNIKSSNFPKYTDEKKEPLHYILAIRVVSVDLTEGNKYLEFSIKGRENEKEMIEYSAISNTKILNQFESTCVLPIKSLNSDTLIIRPINYDKGINQYEEGKSSKEKKYDHGKIRIRDLRNDVNSLTFGEICSRTISIKTKDKMIKTKNTEEEVKQSVTLDLQVISLDEYIKIKENDKTKSLVMSEFFTEDHLFTPSYYSITFNGADNIKKLKSISHLKTYIRVKLENDTLYQKTEVLKSNTPRWKNNNQFILFLNENQNKINDNNFNSDNNNSIIIIELIEATKNEVICQYQYSYQENEQEVQLMESNYNEISFVITKNSNISLSYCNWNGENEN